MLSGTKLAGSNSKRGRVENDFYATNPKAVEMLLSNNEFKKWFWKDYNNGSYIELLEPCVGQGHIIQGIKSYYNNKNLPIHFTCLDIVDRGYDNVIVQDFMEYDTDKRFDCIMTNPPYEIAMEFAQKGMELLKPNVKMCMFLKIQFLEGRKRREFFNKYPPRYIYVFEKRMGTWRNGEEFEETEDGKKKRLSTTMCHAWFCWEKGFTGEPIVRWVR